MISRIFFLFLALQVCALGACKKFIDVDPPRNRISSANVYDNDATAIAVLNGIYTRLIGPTNFDKIGAGIPHLSFMAGLTADELSLWSGASPQFKMHYKNSLKAAGGGFWQAFYEQIHTANVAIDGITTSTKLSVKVKDQLLGEAKFIRGLYYFYLLNLFGEVPLVLTTDYSISGVLSRAKEKDVYQQIVIDLKEAQQLLSDGFVKSDAVTIYAQGEEERIRPNKSAATALLARVLLFAGNFDQAEAESSDVIRKTNEYELLPLNDVFKKNSREAIWQIPSVDAIFNNTIEAAFFVLTAPAVGVGRDHPVFLSPSLVTSFEDGDQRRIAGNWVEEFTTGVDIYYFANKYKDASFGGAPTEYTTLLRLGEVYLIRAEARAQLGDIAGAQDDLNTIRSRAGLPNTTAADQWLVLDAILHERRTELFCENGHRWLDLNRTKTIDSVMINESSHKGSTWDPNQHVYPIPLSEISRNPNMTQNPGY